MIDIFEKLERLKGDLKRNQAKRAELDEKIKEIERKITEEEKASVHELMRSANLSPEELARLISFSKSNTPMSKPLTNIVRAEDEDEE